ncbi:HD family phosphohydrolase [Streptobacillus moniliformis]|uniref:7TM receptor with intracellular metal dependent phosphohydrolase n=1 Tax=Streptobacillus moniliformis (strain ATCC 14647 / DSM 12112 / NCTC 10651 / 9901) TaxID=519441 RepID=D1AXI3_STRM9|nr:HDIG domain-containing metalloprotein [Streptobacillus moniliformis]ACZ01009.1 7TM receptor with intracellular metal dependent phosphohydrolase [Streptobacillus moniliformis DSM 12112]AVL42618.1 HDIG domain-containing protein [Streptobacillus moniliformis]SQA13852.1 Predicted HD superfamily hydrolase [Streptobacillus moniliformis]
MKISFFGKILQINIVNNKIEKGESILKKLFKQNVNRRVIMYISMVAIFFMFMAINNNSNNYAVGTIAKKDVIAHKDVSYTKDILDDELKRKIKQNTTPEYDEIKDVAKNQLDKLEQFLQNINQIDLNNDTEILKFIRTNNLRLTVNEVKTIGISKSVKYYLFLSNVLEEIYKSGVVNKTDFNKILAEKQIVLANEEKRLLLNFIEPNLEINKFKTLAKIEKNMENLKNNVVVIEKGDIVLKEGTVITDAIYDKLKNLGYVHKSDGLYRIVGEIILFIIVSGIFFNYSIRYLKEDFTSKSFYPLLLTLIFSNSIYILLYNNSNLKYFVPYLLTAIIASVLVKNWVFTISLITFNYIFVLEDLKWVFAVIFLSILITYINKSVTSRNEIVKNSIYIGMIQSLVAFSMGLISNINLIQIIPNVIISLVSGLIMGIVSLGLLPYFENTFKILTDIKLLELSNFSNPLLKNLLLTAPGTFHHSLMVGALSEAGAEAVNANPILCRVASYYHDIGKMKRPEYFVENQYGIKNPHNNLKPALSALIIISHVKDGYILGKKYNLPDEILDVILSHHGNTLVQYFYYQALENKESVIESDFRYEGPKPTTKESGIVMLADTIEAAVRANADKSSENVEKIVRHLIKSKVEDGQLSECDMTMNEIEKVTKAFLNIIRGIYHERIQYKRGN